MLGAEHVATFAGDLDQADLLAAVPALVLVCLWVHGIVRLFLVDLKVSLILT